MKLTKTTGKPVKGAREEDWTDSMFDPKTGCYVGGRLSAAVLRKVSGLRAGIVVVALAACAGQASALDKGAVAIYGGAAVADLGSTEAALMSNPRAFESNPLLRDRGVRVATKVGVAAGLVALDSRLGKRGKRVMRVAVIALAGFATVNNLRRMK